MDDNNKMKTQSNAGNGGSYVNNKYNEINKQFAAMDLKEDFGDDFGEDEDEEEDEEDDGDFNANELLNFTNYQNKRMQS